MPIVINLATTLAGLQREADSYMYVRLPNLTRFKAKKPSSPLLNEVPDSLYSQKIPSEWRQMKVVMILKPGNGHRQAKGWRPINLINCLGKVGEKVVAGRLQEAGLLHPLQFGSIKGRSAMDAVVRVVTEAQKTLVRGGSAGAVMEDVKGAFNIVRRRRLLEQFGSTDRGSKWVTWVKNFMDKRESTVEWDS